MEDETFHQVLYLSLPDQLVYCEQIMTDIQTFGWCGTGYLVVILIVLLISSNWGLAWLCALCVVVVFIPCSYYFARFMMLVQKINQAVEDYGTSAQPYNTGKQLMALRRWRFVRMVEWLFNTKWVVRQRIGLLE